MNDLRFRRGRSWSPAFTAHSRSGSWELEFTEASGWSLAAGATPDAPTSGSGRRAALQDSKRRRAPRMASVSCLPELVPGFWMVWRGWQGHYRKMWFVFVIMAVIFTAIYAFAALSATSSNGPHADGWDTMGIVYWATNALAGLFFCAVVGALIGKYRHRTTTKNLNG